MADSKDTQEEKSQPDWTNLPSCLNLDVLTRKQGHRRDKDPKENVVLSCLKMLKDEGSGEEPTCPRYLCNSEPVLLDCSAINLIQSYNLIQCPKEGQELLESHKCWAKSTKDFQNIDLCCPPEVLEDEEPREIEQLLATKKLSAMDPQEAIGDHQTLKHPWSAPRKLRSSPEQHNLAYPPPTHTSLFLHTDPDYQCPRLGQESSQGWVIAAGATGVVGAMVVLGYLVYLVLRWWRGRVGQRGWRKEQQSSKKPLRAEEGLGKGQDGDGDVKFWGGFCGI